MNTQIFASLARYVLAALLVFFGLALLILGSPKSPGSNLNSKIKRNASLGNTATRMNDWRRQTARPSLSR